MTSHAYLLDIEGLFTQESQPGRSFGDSVDGIFALDSFDWSNGLRYHNFDTRSDAAFTLKKPGFKMRVDDVMGSICLARSEGDQIERTAQGPRGQGRARASGHVRAV